MSSIVSGVDSARRPERNFLRHPERTLRHPKRSEGSPEGGSVRMPGDPSLRSG